MSFNIDDEHCGQAYNAGFFAGIENERAMTLEGLDMVARMVLKPSLYRDGYIQAMKDIADDSLPNAARFNQPTEVKGENK